MLGLRAGLGLLSRALPRRRAHSRRPGCLPPFRRPFGYVEIALHVHSDSVSSSRRRALPEVRSDSAFSLHQSGIAIGSTSAFVSTSLAPKP